MTDDQVRPTAAAIDIGSNSIKMTVARLDGAGGLEQIDWASEVVRLGQGLEETGRLDEARMNAAIDALARFAARAQELGASQVMAVATEATRSAQNGNAFLERVMRETGIDVRIVDGLEEATLTFRGLAATTDLSGGALIADIGGGSTELILEHDGTLLSAQSIPLGSGRLTERFINADPPLEEELAASEREADSVIRTATKAQPLPEDAEPRLIIVGGTGEFMARLVPDETAIDLNAVRTTLARMRVLTAAELADVIDVPEARARVLPAGVTIVAALAARVRPSRIEISRSGVRAGLLIEAFAASDQRSAEHSDISESSVAGSTPPLDAGSSAEANQTTATFDAGFRETMKALIAERWLAVWQTIPAALDGTDIEGVHDVRVASRRLRAAMDVAAPVFSQGWYKPLHRAAKDITGALGEVRDRDVLLEALRADREKSPLAERPGIDRLISRIDRERVSARKDMERYLTELRAGPLANEIVHRFGPHASPKKKHLEADGA